MGRYVLMAGWILAAVLPFVSHMAWAQGDPALIARGTKIYAEKKCTACHLIKGLGGKTGGDLTDVGTKRDARWLTTFMKDPKSLVPNGKMPPFRGSDRELESLVEYLSSLK